MHAFKLNYPRLSSKMKNLEKLLRKKRKAGDLRAKDQLRIRLLKLVEITNTEHL